MEYPQNLKDLLDQGQEGVSDSQKNYQLVNERIDTSGTTGLMNAAINGDCNYIELLIKHGAEVNVCDNERRMVIDYALEGNHPEVILMLLTHSSLLPLQLTGENLCLRFKSLVDQLEGLNNCFSQRDSFHKMLVERDTKDVEDKLKTFQDELHPPRYFIDSDGESVLYKALKNKRHNTWAMLRAVGFEYASEEERNLAREIESELPFVDAIGNHFIELQGCHVQKIVAKSKVYGCKEEDVKACSKKVEEYFLEMDREEYSSAILQCLQDDPSLKIIFDFSSTNIHGIHPMEGHGQVWGITELEVNRIYVTAKETEEFKYRDIISNLAHECAHKAYAIVFENGGLPYKRDNAEAEEEYGKVVRTVLSRGRVSHCDAIIRRVADYKEIIKMKRELIVKVPEMMSKYYTHSDVYSLIKDGKGRLKIQASELLCFCDEWVQSELIDYVKRNSMAGKFRLHDWQHSCYFDDEIQVNESLSAPSPCRHNSLSLLKVSNLKLGVSHLKLSLKEVTFVDWTRYLKNTNIFRIAVRRNEIKTLAIVWDEEEVPWFCKSDRFCQKSKCISQQFNDQVLRSLILILPLKVPVPKNIKSIEYTWIDLSEDTKNSLLLKELYFGGNVLKLRDLLEIITEKDTVASQKVTPEIMFDPNVLSKLIDEETIEIGRPLKSNLKEREVDLLQKHPECFIHRSLVVSCIEFNRLTFERRANDVFFISNARKEDLKDSEVGRVLVWNGEEIPKDVRCFILSGLPNSANNMHVFQEITEKFRAWNRKNGVKWHYAHFFELVNGDYTLIGSLNCKRVPNGEQYTFECSGLSLLECDTTPNEVLLVADSPGSGKSVFVNKVALEVKEKYVKCWVDVIELSLFEESFKTWEINKVVSQESVKDLLYELLKTGEKNYIEEALFQLFFLNGHTFFIFFDGFDEICPIYRTVVTDFLVMLTNIPNIKMCLTTRVHESVEMEGKLSTLAYKFVPFSRAEQIGFLNLEWNASLRYLSLDEKRKKFENIIRALQTSDIFKEVKCFPGLHENLRCLSNNKVKVKYHKVDFDEVADRLIKMGESAVEDQADFSENPLHAWMLALVVFEENFEVEKSLSLHQLYGKFVKIKIDMYSREKLRTKECVAGDAKDIGFEKNMYRMLKDFSAYFFLDDEEFEWDEKEEHEMLRVGLVARIRNSNVFVHRTIGEYIFSLWLLEKCKEKKVTKVWLSKVLLEKQFHKIRQFINSILLFRFAQKSETVCQKTFLLKRLTFDKPNKEKKFVESIQKCVFMSILECHIGVTEYFSKSFSELLIDIMFRKVDWDIRTLEFPIIHMDGEWNAFTFCGMCIRGNKEMTYSEQAYNTMPHHDRPVGNESVYKLSRRSELDYLKYLTKLLHLMEEHNLASNLKSIISTKGLSWMGFNEYLLWSSESGREYFSFLFSFLERNRNHLSEALRAKLCENESIEIFTNGAAFLFDALIHFLESILEKTYLPKLIVNWNVLRGWSTVFQACGVEDVEKMWKYLTSKLERKEDRKKILEGVDDRGNNAIYSACANWEHREVLPFVWYVCQEEMSQEEFKDYLFKSFSRTMDSVMLKADRLLDRVSDVVANGSLERSSAVRLLDMVDEMGKHYLLSVNTNFSPKCFFKFQKFLTSEDLGTREILENMENHYVWLAPSCFERLDQYNEEEEFTAEVEDEFQRIIHSIESFPFVDLIQMDEEGCLIGILDEYQRKIRGIHLKLFLVLLRHQLRLESRMLGQDQLVLRLSEEFIWIYNQFPIFTLGERSIKTKSFLIPYFLAVVLEFLPKEKVREILFYDLNVWGNIFNYLSFKKDLDAYNKCNEVAKWMEMSLSKVLEERMDKAL